jgi:hypothetical protein
MEINGLLYLKESVSSACFSYFVSIIAKGDSIAKLAVSSPLRTQNNYAREITQVSRIDVGEQFTSAGLYLINSNKDASQLDC